MLSTMNGSTSKDLSVAQRRDDDPTAVIESADSNVTFRWPVHAEQVIAASPAEVWRVISTPGNLENCHPFCASNPVHEWPGADSRDEVRYLSGWIYERRFRNWIEGTGYDLEIGRPGGGQSRVSWRIAPIDDHSCVLRITVCPHTLQSMPVVIRWIPYLLVVRPQLRKYLDSVVRGVEYFTTKHQPVPRNAFGAHAWFSAS